MINTTIHTSNATPPTAPPIIAETGTEVEAGVGEVVIVVVVLVGFTSASVGPVLVLGVVSTVLLPVLKTEQSVIAVAKISASVTLYNAKQELHSAPPARIVEHAQIRFVLQDPTTSRIPPHSGSQMERALSTGGDEADVVTVECVVVVDCFVDVDAADPAEYPSAEQLVIPDPRREASVMLRGTQQSLQTGPAASSVEQKHASSEQDEAADTTRPHSVVHSEAAIVVVPVALDVVEVVFPEVELEVVDAENVVEDGPDEVVFGQAVARISEIVAASVGSPELAKQALHAEPLADKVGQRHSSFEQDVAAM